MPISFLGKPESEADLFLIDVIPQGVRVPDEPWQSSFSGSFAAAPDNTPIALKERYPRIFEQLHQSFLDNLFLLVALTASQLSLENPEDSPIDYHQLVSMLVLHQRAGITETRLPANFEELTQELYNSLLSQLPTEFHPFAHRFIAYFGSYAAAKLESQQQWAARYQSRAAHSIPATAAG